MSFIAPGETSPRLCKEIAEKLGITPTNEAKEIPRSLDFAR
jgi:hypothetical protein